MSYEQYWNADCYMVKYYEQAHEIALADQNYMLWLQGLYNYRAMSSCFESFAYGLGGCKGQKPQGYVDNPLPITEAEKKLELQRNIAKTLAWVQAGQEE